jgi:phage shock protein PspC (stress-responsive transcriptional regulator)
MSTDEHSSGSTATGERPSGLQNFFDSLRRSPVTRSSDRWAGGVCAGLAERMGIDPVLVRVLVAVVAFLGGVPAILYGLAWLALPDREGRIEAEAAVHGEVSAGAVVAGLLVLFGGLLPRPWQWWWPGAEPDWEGNVAGTLLVLALVVAALVWLPRWVGGSSSSWRASGERPPNAILPAESTDGAAHTWHPRPVGCQPRRGPGAVMTSAVLGLALLAAGAAALWTTDGGFDISAKLAALLAASAMLGLAMVSLGVAGRTDGAVGVLGVTAVCFALWFAVVPSTARIQTGDTTWTPTSPSSAEDGYVLLFGDGTLDLTDVPVRDGQVVVPVRLGVGSMHVTVPDDVAVTVRSRSLVGDTNDSSQLPPGWTTRGEHSGIGADTTSTSGAGDDEARLVVDVQGLIGDINLEVARS